MIRFLNFYSELHKTFVSDIYFTCITVSNHSLLFLLSSVAHFNQLVAGLSKL